MTRERDDAKIGLLVFLTLALFLGFLFQRSLTAILKKEFHLQVSLDNAGDLAEGTEVQLQGLRVGRVEAVELVRDGVSYRFLADLGLRTDIVLWQGTRALVVAKPLGGAYVDLQLPPTADRREPLAQGAVLAGSSAPSLATLVDRANALVLNLNSGVDQLRGQFQNKGLGALLEHPQVSRVLTTLQDTLQAFQALARDSQVLVRHGDASATLLDRNLASLERSLTGLQQLLSQRSGDIDGIIQHLAGTLKELETLGKDLNGLVGKAGPSGVDAVQTLQRNLRATEELLELLKAKPNRLVWGTPGKAEREAAAQRVKAARQAPVATAANPAQNPQ